MERRRKSRIRRSGAALLCAFLVLLCAGCARRGAPLLIGRGDAYDNYPDAVLTVLPEHVRADGQKDLFYAMGENGAAECFDVQAEPAVRRGAGTYWYPHALATVVIAVDRSKTDAQIRGWRDLRDAGLPAAWNGDAAARTLMLGALGYGLEGEAFTRAGTAEFIRSADGRFAGKTDWNAPLMVCFDYQAASLVRSGRNLEIIVPCEGTLSYALGLLSRRMLPAVPDEILLEKGFRLPDGRCTAQGFPAPEAYRTAGRTSRLEAETMERLPELFADSELLLRSKTGFSVMIPQDGRLYVLALVLVMIAAVAWMGSAVHRAIRPQMQKAVRWMSVLVLCWLMLRLLRCQTAPDSTMYRLCGYAGLLVQPALPAVLLYIALVFDRPESGARAPRRKVIPALLCPVLPAAGILYIFRGEDGYSIVPAAICLYGLLLFLTAAVLLIRKARRSPNRVRWSIPAFSAALFTAFTVGWAAGVPAVRAGDYTLIYCILWLVFMESVLSTGILPANTRYDLLFSSSPLNMQLLDERGRTVLAGKRADELSPVLRIRLCSKASSCIGRDENTLLYGRAIRHGTVIWQEDISALNLLHRQIGESVQRLTAANALLRREGEVQRRTMAADVRIRLFDALEAEIREKTDELSRMIRTLPQCEDKERRMAYITLLLCHIKRRCNLFFLARESGQLPGDELSMYLDELSEFAGYAGVRALVRSSVQGSVDVRRATLCYDFYFSVIAWSVRRSGSTLLGCLEQKDGTGFSILTDGNAGTPDFPDSFLAAVKQAGGTVSCRTLDEQEGIYLEFDGKAAEHG